MRRTVLGILVPLLTLLVSAATAWAQPQDPGFTQVTYASGLGSITDLAWAGDGTNQYLFVTLQGGAIRVIRNGTLQTADVTSVTPINVGSELGLLGIATDPNFSANRRIYIFVSETGSISRIYRYTTTDSGGATGTVGVTGGRMQMGIDMPNLNVNHNGGSVAFGPDGNLYFGVGNNGNGNNVGGDGTANEFNTLGSKIGRMTAGGLPLATSPYYTGAGGARDYIWSRGYRNPFGIAFQPGTNDPWILEVGDAWEHIFLAPAGSNRGWNTENNTSTTNGKLIPRFAYQRNSGPTWAAGGGCITRGCFYSGTVFPAAYQGNLFFAENNGSKLVRAIPNGTGTIPSGNVSLFVDNASGIVDVETGPDGALYYASRGNSAVYRVYYGALTPQNIIVSPSTLTINEGSSGTFTVRLATAPTSNVTVNVARSSGDPDVTASPAMLTFTAATWNTPQTVTVSAAVDPDTINDAATITASSTGLTSQNVVITVIDTTVVAGAPSALITRPLNGDVVSGTTAEFFGTGTDPQGITTLVRAEFRIDGTLVYTDSTPMVTAGDHYHLGGGHNLWNTTTLTNGAHVLLFTVYDNTGLSGSHQITVTVNNPVGGPAVTNLTLMDTGTNLPVAGFDPIPNGATLDRATLPANLSIRANTNPATVGSVVFGYDGNAAYHTESTAPYSISGDNAGVFISWSPEPALGSHTVTATAYTAANGTGTPGAVLTITFTVVNGGVPPPPPPPPPGGGAPVATSNPTRHSKTIQARCGCSTVPAGAPWVTLLAGAMAMGLLLMRRR